MAWIESHQELGAHPKTRKLARLLGVSVPAAVGHLQFLWWWAVDYAPDGDISGCDPEDIAAACMWDGEAETLLTALRACRWIDDGRYLHDWDEYAGRLIAQRAANKERKARSRARHADGDAMSHGRHADNSVTAVDVTALPDQTVPNQTEPNQTETEPEAAAAARDESFGRVLQAWENATGQTISPMTADFLDGWIERVGPDWVIDGIEEMHANSARSPKYLAAILTRWQDDGRAPKPPPQDDMLGDLGRKVVAMRGAG